MHGEPWGRDWTEWMAGDRHGRHRHGPPGFKHGWRQGFWQDLMGEPGHRADRGVVRYLVLAALAEQPRHGYDIMQAIAERSGGSYKPSPGVIYPTLQMLDELGHVRSTEADGRKVFAITEEGRRDLAAHRYEVEDFYDRADASSEWEEHAEIFADLATNVARLYRLYRRAARKGRLSGATKRAVRAELDAAIERIESIIDRDST